MWRWCFSLPESRRRKWRLRGRAAFRCRCWWLAHGGTNGQKEQAAAALGNLAFNADNQVAIAKAGGIAPLVALARDGTKKQKEWAAVALRNLARNADNQVAIAKAGGIAPLVALARDGTKRQKEWAAVALRKLSINADNQVAIREVMFTFTFV